MPPIALARCGENATGRTRCSPSPASPAPMPRLVEGSAPAGELKPELARRWGSPAKPSSPVAPATMPPVACGIGAIRPGEGLSRHLGRAVRHQRKVPAQHRRRRPRLLPRHSQPPGTRWASSSAPPTASTG